MARAPRGRELERVTRALLLHLDGRIPNLALMRLGAWLRGRGVDVELRRAGNVRAVEPRLGDPPKWDQVFASCIFEWTRPVAERVLEVYPDAIVGGTGWKVEDMLEDVVGLPFDQAPDYRDYPQWTQSVGFTQRGCRLRCPFCVVPKKEGAVREIATIAEIWRGDPWPKQLLLLDNDFFGQEHWRDRIEEIRAGRFEVSFNQGINARMLNDETAAAIASVEYRDDQMKRKRIYTAWDNRKDEERLVAGIESLFRAGVAPSSIMVYMLIGYWKGETHEDREHRRRRLRALGVLPYPMVFRRTSELMGYQRWVLRGYDRTITWDEWTASRFQARPPDQDTLELFGEDLVDNDERRTL